MKHRKIAIAGFAASMLVGAGTGLVLNLPGSAGASPAALTATPPDDGRDDSAATTDSTATARSERGLGLGNALVALVTAGTINQEQADAIVAAFEANRPEGGPGGRGPGGGHGPGGHGRPGFGRGPGADAAATALGITLDELKTELQAGKTVADVASDRGVAIQTVIDAIVTAQTAEITERVTNMVNGVEPVAPDKIDAVPEDATTPTTTG